MEIRVNVFLLVLIFAGANCLNSAWMYECAEKFCRKTRITNTKEPTTILSLNECHLTCNDYASIWPAPTGKTTHSKKLVQINPSTINVTSPNNPNDLVEEAAKIFLANVKKHDALESGANIKIIIDIIDTSVTRMTLDVNETYTLKADLSAGEDLTVKITAQTFFGARNGLETYGQLLVFDDLRGVMKTLDSIYISDGPVYPYRGVTLDTARNYIDVASIKRTIDAMGVSKLNTLHWHVTDTNSFPFVSKSLPSLSKLGAYSATKVYTPEDVAGLVWYGKARGVRIVPEFDAPSHVGEGWQDTGFVVCFEGDWRYNHCTEPPCGQFDPTIPELYDALEGLYGDLVEAFDPVLFHMGGDEVRIPCWNSTPSIVTWMSQEHNWPRTQEGFMKLWNYFQTRALARLDKKIGNTNTPIIMWTSTLTEGDYINYLPKDKYIIQAWFDANDPFLKLLLQKGYRIVISNSDAVYFDCGFSGWFTDGVNWCSPYKGWQQVYDNSATKVAGEFKGLVMGSSVVLWSEEADGAAVDSRIWPRAAAMAEQFWSEPATSWREAESRMLVHRERLVHLGVAADSLQPEWCLQHQNQCPVSPV